MEQIMNYVKPELLIVAVVLYFIGMSIKKSEVIPDKYIPAILGALGILICGIYVIATCAISGAQEIAMAIFTAITQGILVAGLGINWRKSSDGNKYVVEINADKEFTDHGRWILQLCVNHQLGEEKWYMAQHAKRWSTCYLS